MGPSGQDRRHLETRTSSVSGRPQHWASIWDLVTRCSGYRERSCFTKSICVKQTLKSSNSRLRALRCTAGPTECCGHGLQCTMEGHGGLKAVGFLIRAEVLLLFFHPSHLSTQGRSVSFKPISYSEADALMGCQSELMKVD